jgi:nitrogen fixation/metabolism regulation signal transduction histidine kinase
MKSILCRFNLKIFVSIFLLCLFWIIGTDFLVYLYQFDPENLLTVNICKGILFVFFVSLYIAYTYEKEKKLLQQKEYDYSRFFVQSPEPMIICGQEDLIIQECNISALSFLGLSSPETKKYLLNDIVKAGDELLGKLSSNENLDIIDAGIFQLNQSRQSEVFANLRLFNVFFRGRSCYLVKFIDQTDLLEAQEVTALNSKLITLGEISANIGHEIKNPLTIIILALSKLRSNLVKNQIKSDELDMIESAFSRIETTITSLQRISRNEYYDKKDFIQLDRLINDAIILTWDQINQNNIDVKTSVEDFDGL